MSRIAGVFAGFLLFLSFPTLASAQAWPDFVDSLEGEEQGHFHWVVGTYQPLSELGSFGRYSIIMDPWITIGVSGRTGKTDDRFRTRFEMTVTPEANLRRSFEDCADCTPKSRRLTVANWRFLLDWSVGLGGGDRAYATAGPFMRVQLGEKDLCSRSSGAECALAAFGRSRVDPGLMVGAGWEPDADWLQAIQVGGRMTYYGREPVPEASPVSWLPAVELSAHFPF